MANWYYYNKSGEKVGPITVAVLKALAMQGLITPETIIDNGNGRSAVAGKVNGLTFPKVTTPEPVTPLLSSADDDVYGLSSPQPMMTPPVQPVVPPVAIPSSESNSFMPGITVQKSMPFFEPPVSPNSPPLDLDPFSTLPSLSATPFSAAHPQPVPVPQLNTTNPALLVICGVVGTLLVGVLIWAGMSLFSGKTTKPSEVAKVEAQSVSPNTEGAGNEQVKPPKNTQSAYTAAEQEEIDNFCTKYGTDVTAVDKDGITLLHIAVADKSVAVTKFLIAKGADVNFNTPINWAVFSSNVEIVRLLVANGADVNDKRLLQSAIDGDNVEIVKSLVENGADVNAEGANGFTPLCWAVIHKKIEIVKLLVSKGADVNAKYLGSTLLQSAALGDDVEILQQLLASKEADVNADASILLPGKTLLQAAVGLGKSVDIVKLLISKEGADVNIKDKDGYTLLHWAVIGGNVAIAQLLISNGADVNAKNDIGTTPLQLAIVAKNVEMVMLLGGKK